MILNEKTQKRKYLDEEVQEIQRKKTRFESDITALTKPAEVYADQAEEKGDTMLIAKSNSLRRSAKEKGKQLAELDAVFKEKQIQLKIIIKTGHCIHMQFFTTGLIS